MKPIGFVYLTTNLVNGKIYIGQHKFLEDKWFNAKYLGSGTVIEQAIKKYGRKNFKRKILKLCYTVNQLNGWETYYTLKYNPNLDPNIGYNQIIGPVRRSGNKNPMAYPNVRKKISGKNHYLFGKHCSEETKKKLSEKLSGENNPFYGKHHPKGKMSKILKDYYKTEKGRETINKVKNKLKGRKMSEEHKEKIRQGNLGVKRSEETRRRMSESRKGMKYKKKKI
jgi:group I intron endonuclease